MDFIFKDVSELDISALSQVDVIARTAEVIERIGQAHQYYADAPHYSHFVVLTQSCDLVRRRDGNFNAPYITIAAAGSFKETVQEFIDGKAKMIKGTSFSYHSHTFKDKAQQFIERYINNTEPEFFFLPESGHPNIHEDLVVFLRLTIALRKGHYDVLAQAKIAELADIFQAKLGWLKGNIYSRVATPDLEEREVDAKEIKKDYYDQYIPEGKMVWLSGLQLELLRKLIKKQTEQFGGELQRDAFLEIIRNQIPEDTQIVARDIAEQLKRRKLIDEGDVEKCVKAVAGVSSFKALVKSQSR